MSDLYLHHVRCVDMTWYDLKGGNVKARRLVNQFFLSGLLIQLTSQLSFTQLLLYGVIADDGATELITLEVDFTTN